MRISDKRSKDFFKNIAKGMTPEKAAIKAGYTKKTARAKAYKWLEDSRADSEIQKYKEIAEEINSNEFKYDVVKCFKQLETIRIKALQPDKNGNYTNLMTAIKAVENQARLFGLFEKDNKQKNASDVPYVIEVATEKDKEYIEKLRDIEINRQ